MPEIEEVQNKTKQPPRRTPGIREGHPAIAPGTKRLVGTLRRIHDAGYGFIRVESGAGQGEYYININSMRDRSAWKPDQVLSFLPGRASEGKATPAYDAKVVALVHDKEDD